MQAAVIGAGPAGLAAAEVLAQVGAKVTVYEAKPSPARKFLMAGKSGLNLTLAGDFEKLLSGYGDRADLLEPALQAFDNAALQAWAAGLGQEMFTGSSGRVFPKVMKASPLLRAWLARLDTLGVQIKTRWRWSGWRGSALRFETANGLQEVTPDVTVLACGGASWARLGSDGAWAQHLETGLVPFAAANVGLRVNWSDKMQPHFGAPIKNVEWCAGPLISRGEAVLSAAGLEGGGIYSVSRAVRDGSALHANLLPDMQAEQIAQRLAKPRGKTSLSNHLRKCLRLDKTKLALLQEWGRPLPHDPHDPHELAMRITQLPVPVEGLADMDGAISTAGGISFDALTPGFMLKERPGVFCAGEMLDWEAPTGGWLLTACFATGRWAGQHAAQFAKG